MLPNIKVLIIDDSAYARLAISRELQSSENITIVGTARNGIEGIEKIKELKPNVVTLDVEMPEMDGLATLERIMAECPVPIVMLSSLTGNGTDTTIKALELGAVDFFLKQSLANPVGAREESIDLKTKIIMASRTKPEARICSSYVKSILDNKFKKSEARQQKAKKLVVIGSSTGGPKALYEVIPHLPENLPAAVLVVQHMPPGFTNSLARRLNELSQVTVREVTQGDMLHDGEVFLARGGYHMVITGDHVLGINQNAPVCNVRPSVDVTMESSAIAFNHLTLGVVMTGMGCDGTYGARCIKNNGGHVIAEDKSTCVVWGMPKSVAEAGLADNIIPLPKIADKITSILEEIN